MTSQLPKLRDDLEIRRHTSDGTIAVVKDPISGELFRVKTVELSIMRQLDGATPLDVIQSRLEQRVGGSIRSEALVEFVKALDRNGLLQSERGTNIRHPRRVSGSLLYFRVRLFDPDRLLRALVPRLRWCFTPAFVFTCACVILIAVATAALHWEEIGRDAARLYGLSALPLLMVTVFSVITLHELAHGLTCKYFGGEVHEIGFMLMYFQPALYCNVSDAWLFPEKSKRLWVGFAGPYFELVIWALATLAWRLTNPATLLNGVALVVMVSSGIKTLYNFNPLIKLDGYYLLSDYLEIPNLRRKSMEYIGGFLKRLVGFGNGPAPECSPRERRVFLTYGVVASAFSFSLLGYIGFAVGDYLLTQDQRFAFVAFAGVLGSRFRFKLRKLFRGNAASSSKRKFPLLRKKRRIVVFVALPLLTSLLFLSRMQLRVTGPVDVLPLHNADVRAEVAGIIDEIRVDEGDHVLKGDVIARLSDRDYRAELEKTEAEIRQTDAKLDLLVAGPTNEQIAVARAAVMKAEDRLEFARARLTRDTELFEREIVSRTDFDTTRELESTAQNELVQAKSQLGVLLKGTRVEEIEAAKAELARLEAQRRYLSEQLRLIDVVSPATGVVTTPSRQLKEMVRRTVQRGDLIAKVFELENVTVQVAVPEREIAGVEVGQNVAVKVRAYPSRIFHGRITRIATTAQALNASASAAPGAGMLPSAAAGGKSSNVVLVITETDNREGLLKPGMTGVAKIYCGERRFIDLVMRRLSLTFKVEFWSWW